jgi:hypothetical protein
MGEGCEICECEKRNIYRILLFKTVGKRPLGSSGLRRNCRFEMGLEGITCEDAVWIDLALTRNR